MTDVGLIICRRKAYLFDLEAKPLEGFRERLDEVLVVRSITQANIKHL